MKAIITFLAIASMLTATAQKISEKDLLGSWPVAAIEMKGTLIDFEQNKVTFSEEKRKTLTPGQQEALQKGMIAGLDALRGIRLEFAKGGKITFAMGGDTEQGTYTMTERNGKFFLTSDILGTPGSEITVYPDRLEATQQHEDGPLHLVFKKKKN